MKTDLEVNYENRIRDLEQFIEDGNYRDSVSARNILENRLPPLKKWLHAEVCKVMVRGHWQIGVILREASDLEYSYIVAYHNPRMMANDGWFIGTFGESSIEEK